MPNMDMKNNLSVAQSITPAAYTADTNGAGVDLANFGGALVIIDAGVDTDGSHTFEVQESDDDSTYTAVADADLIGTEPVVAAPADGDQIYRIGYVGSKRYIRVATTVTGTTTGAVYGASVVRSGARKAPIS